jgi:hypothetical protein
MGLTFRKNDIKGWLFRIVNVSDTKIMFHGHKDILLDENLKGLSSKNDGIL